MLTMQNAAQHVGKVVDNGHCVRFLQVHAAAPHTAKWRRGELVRGGVHPPGTLIATFSPATGRYENDTTGRSHAAVLVEQTAEGLRVIDQWQGRPVGERLIPFRGGVGSWVNDGDRYHVITVQA